MARRGTAGTAESQEATTTAPQVMSASNSTPTRGDGNTQATSTAASQGGQMSFSSDQIAQRAYEIYERDGRRDGRDMDHWLQAERELREERGRSRQTASQGDGRVSDQSREAASRPPRPEEAPRSARRHQASMA